MKCGGSDRIAWKDADAGGEQIARKAEQAGHPGGG